MLTDVPETKVTARTKQPSKPEPTVRMIIAAARSQAVRPSSLGAWLCAGVSALLLYASFTPLDWGPLAWVALAPLLLLVRIEQRTRFMYAAVYGAGLAMSLALLQWMRLGHPTMYVAWAALSVYVAAYLPAFVVLTRLAVHRLGAPLAVAAPVVWVGLEYLRAHLMTGFSWYYLGHTQYAWTTMIQISDLVGAYGVSFVVALSSAALAELVPLKWLAALRLLPAGVDVSALSPQRLSRRQIASAAGLLAVFAASWTYGAVRLNHEPFPAGPRVALIQGNFTTEVKHDPTMPMKILNRHHQLTGLAVQKQPDLIVWPETMFRDSLRVVPDGMGEAELKKAAPRIPANWWLNSQVDQILADMSQQAGAAMVIGIDTVVAEPNGYRHYNSAAFVRPDLGLNGRYDKLHRVPFGEYIPLNDEMPWLRNFTPFGDDFGIAAGEGAAVFEYQSYRFAPIICFEDTVPHLVRGLVKSTAAQRDGKPVDCLVNLTNDGWFHGSSELDQHLITASFRAVECRTPLVRAVNTGVSAFVNGDGVVIEPDHFIDGDGEGRKSMRDPKTGRWHKQLNAALVADVPLDPRGSLYVRHGDWFAAGCGGLTLMILASLFWRRRETSAERRGEPPAP